MALDLVGERLGQDTLDIHAGGIDLIFPHHEDEIAQSCAHTGRDTFARVWVHGEFLTMAGTKMSKRFGNILTARDLREERVDPGTVRLLFATTHYRAPLDFSDESLEASREGSRRLGAFAERLEGVPVEAGAGFDAAAERLQQGFAAAMDDDLNTPRALAALFEAAREGNRLLDLGEAPSPDFVTAWQRATEVLQVLPDREAVARVAAGEGNDHLSETPPDDPAEAHAWARAWASRRLSAKGARDYPAADRIRALLADHGWQVRDGRDGTAEVRRDG
jgi:cysteinyl-tRNA synthetase